MKLLFVIKTLNSVRGGAEKVLADITAELVTRNFDITILTFDRINEVSVYPIDPRVKRISLAIGDVLSNTTKAEAFRRVIGIRKTAKTLRPDVMVAFMHSSYVFSAFAMIGSKIPVIASEHITRSYYENRKFEYILLLLSSFFVKKITILSNSIAKDFPFFIQNKMIPITNPINQNYKLSDPMGSKSPKKVILSVGRLTERKDQVTLIKSFRLLEKDFPNWNLKIVGDGVMRKILEKTISELDLGKKVFLPGVSSNITKEYQSAHIFAISSKFESFGLVTAEAMAHGLPTVGFDSPGTRDLILNNKNGLLIDGESDRVKNLATGLKTLMENDELRKKMGTEGLKTIKKFDPAIIAKHWIKLLETI